MKDTSRQFLPIGRLYERTSKLGTPYLAGTMAEHPVFLFPQGDGTWNAFVQIGGTPAPATAARTVPDDDTAYDHTLAGVEVPDYDEPVQRRTLRVSPRRSAARRSSRTEPE